MDKISLVAISAPILVVLCGFIFESQKPSLTVKSAKEKITINVVCIDGYEYIQNTISGSTMSGVIYTQRFINTDDRLRAKICRDTEKEADADAK